MPMHDYRCQACGACFELLLRPGTAPACRQCGSTALERQLALTAPPGRSRAIMAAGRRAAAREGHLSHCSRAERSTVR